MELVFKLPKNKPPFIGIVFDGIYEASKLNSHLVEEHQTISYSILIEYNGQLNLRLVSSGEFNFFYCYSNLKFDREKLKNWLDNTLKTRKFNFSHLIKNYDNHIVVETQKEKKLFVLKIESVYLLTD